MDLNRFEKLSDFVWRLPAEGPMRVPGLVFVTEDLIAAMDDKVGEQIRNVASLPGIVGASLAMPDAHWGYGFPIGGVAAFDADEGGVVSAGGVGFDISCGVRTLHTGLTSTAIERVKDQLAACLRSAGIDRRQHGHVLVRARGHGHERRACIQLRVSRCRPQHEPT